MPALSALALDIDAESHRLNASDYKGSPNNPYTFDGLCDKFRRYTAASIDHPIIQSIVKLVSFLEGVPDIAALTRLLTVPAA